MDITTPHYLLNSTVNLIAGNAPTKDDDRRVISAAQLALIDEEFREFLAAWAARDRRGIRDGLADMIVTLDGWFYRMGFSAQEVEAALNTQHWVDDYIEKCDIGKSDYSLVGLFCMTAHPALTNKRDTDDYGDPLDPLTISSAISGMSLIVESLCKALAVDLAADQWEVYCSNMSKFDTSEEDAAFTRAKYAQLDVVTETIKQVVPASSEDGEPRTYWVTKSTHDQTGRDGKQYPRGKFLKSVRFREPVFR